MKATKEFARYSAKSDNPKTRCKDCEHFQKPSACSRVIGTISANGWCRLWQSAKKTLQRMAG